MVCFVLWFRNVYPHGSRVLHDRLKGTLQCLRHSSAHSGQWSFKLRYLWIMRDFAHSWITEQPTFVRAPLCRDANHTETVFFNRFFTFVLYGHKDEECNMTWPIAHEAYRCTLWTSCTGMSCKRPFLSMIRYSGYSCLTDMRILVLRVLNTGSQSTLKRSYLGCFWFSSSQGYIVNKRRHYRAGGTALHMLHGQYCTRYWVVHILDNSNFCVR